MKLNSNYRWNDGLVGKGKWVRVETGWVKLVHLQKIICPFLYITNVLNMLRTIVLLFSRLYCMHKKQALGNY